MGGAFEQLVLLASIRLAGRVFGGTVHAEIRARTGRRVCLRAVNRTLDRLRERGLVEVVALPPGLGRPVEPVLMP